MHMLKFIVNGSIDIIIPYCANLKPSGLIFIVFPLCNFLMIVEKVEEHGTS